MILGYVVSWQLKASWLESWRCPGRQRENLLWRGGEEDNSGRRLYVLILFLRGSTRNATLTYPHQPIPLHFICAGGYVGSGIQTQPHRLQIKSLGHHGGTGT